VFRRVVEREERLTLGVEQCGEILEDVGRDLRAIDLRTEATPLLPPSRPAGDDLSHCPWNDGFETLH
jgi:hypothetical protein